jgi:hypothetical protein
MNLYRPSSVHFICYKGNRSINWYVCAWDTDPEFFSSWLLNNIVNIKITITLDERMIHEYGAVGGMRIGRGY